MAKGDSNTPVQQQSQGISSTIQPPLREKTFPAFQPGHRQMLAEQMTKGFGAPVSANLGLLSQIFEDQTIPMILNQDDMRALRNSQGNGSGNKKKKTGPTYHMGVAQSGGNGHVGELQGLLAQQEDARHY